MNRELQKADIAALYNNIKQWEKKLPTDIKLEKIYRGIGFRVNFSHKFALSIICPQDMERGIPGEYCEMALFHNAEIVYAQNIGYENTKRFQDFTDIMIEIVMVAEAARNGNIIITRRPLSMCEFHEKLSELKKSFQ